MDVILQTSNQEEIIRDKVSSLPTAPVGKYYLALVRGLFFDPTDLYCVLRAQAERESRARWIGAGSLRDLDRLGEIKREK